MNDINDNEKIVKEEEFKSSDVKEKKVKTSKDKKIIILIIVGLILLIVGFFLIFSKKEQDVASEGGFYSEEETGSDEEIINISIRNIKDFSAYKNFKVNYYEKMDSTDLSYLADIDMINKNMKVTFTMFDTSQYIYYDIFNGMHYISNDNNNWLKNVNEEVSLPNYSAIFNKIKSNVGVTSSGNGQFSFNYTFILSRTVYNNVPTVVNFDKNGFLKKISYNLSGLVSGVKEYTITYEFSNVNQLGSVEIPDDVVNNATESKYKVNINI